MAPTPKIVDTNVCVVSNRQGHATIQCAARCAKELLAIVQEGALVIDEAGAIVEEYRKHLRFSGQPGPGDRFFKWLVDNRYKSERVFHVTLTPHHEREADFEEFPDDPQLRGFDLDDRVFVAAAVAHPQHPEILNAVDSDYWHFRAQLERNGITVTHVCGHSHFKPRTGS